MIARRNVGRQAGTWPHAAWWLVPVLMILAVRVTAEERNAYRVKNAFREVVSDASHGTVRVLCDGRRVAYGAVVEKDGYVLTKASELNGEIECQLYDGRKLAASIVGAHDDWDLALLKIEAKELAVIAWSEGDAPPVGSWLATPGLETIPISVGVVSVAPRKIERILPALGVILEDSAQGPRVNRVVDNSGAARAGVLAGDLITQLDGKDVDTRDSLIQSIQTRRPGDKVQLGLRRGDASLTLEAQLGELSQLLNGDRDEFQNTLGGRLSERRAGFPLALQHDTVLQPNQCGGPLVDLDGKVVGINIARASRVGSLAVPASMITPLLAELKSGKLIATTKPD